MFAPAAVYGTPLGQFDFSDDASQHVRVPDGPQRR